MHSDIIALMRKGRGLLPIYVWCSRSDIVIIEEDHAQYNEMRMDFDVVTKQAHQGHGHYIY